MATVQLTDPMDLTEAEPTALYDAVGWAADDHDPALRAFVQLTV